MSDVFNSILGPSKKAVRFKCAFHNTIYDVLSARGWIETESELDWDIFWCEKDWIREVLDTVHLSPGQKVNHFRSHYELTRKDNLAKHIRSARKDAIRSSDQSLAQALDVVPTTFMLPTEYPLFCRHFKESSSNSVWIMKPIGRSQGKGIFLINKIGQVADWMKQYRSAKLLQENIDPYVCQRYISDPFLIGGRKFDLRIYVLVTSYRPLTAWLYRSGFCRFAFEKFDGNSLADLKMHLTNVAIQKTAKGYSAEDGGGKWGLDQLRIYLQGFENGSPGSTFKAIENLIETTFLSIAPHMRPSTNSFELYGLDIVLDSKLKPWLLEVNASPSLTASTESDYFMKFDLLDDVLTVVDFDARGVVACPGRVENETIRCRGISSYYLSIYDRAVTALCECGRKGGCTRRVGSFDALIVQGNRVNGGRSHLGVPVDDRRAALARLARQISRGEGDAAELHGIIQAGGEFAGG